MDDQAKEKLIIEVNKITPTDATMTFDALKAAIERIHQRIDKSRMASILFFTDGISSTDQNFYNSTGSG